MNAKQRVQVPFGLKKKLMAATSMLLVAAIMLVSTSYAWFTLSTAPEITGITTSVGANGNLEIALLTTETAADMSLITSNTGDSMDATGQSVTKANITWGNLIDLSDASYGLSQIALYPAALNDTNGALGEAPLTIPEYGADGRVAALVANTISAVYDEDSGGFSDNGVTTAGVRAVGTSDSVSPRQLIFKTAKNTAVSKMNTAINPTKSAFIKYKNNFVTLALAMKDSGTDTYSYEELVAMKAIAEGAQSSLNSIVSAYANAGLAKAAADTSIADSLVTTCSTELAGVTDAAALKTSLNNAGVKTYDSELTALVDEQAAVKQAVEVATALLTGADENTTYGSTATTYVKETASDGTETYYTQKEAIDEYLIKTLLGGASYVVAYGDDKTTADVVETNSKVELNKDDVAYINAMYLTGGTVGGLANYVGTYKIDHLDALIAEFDLYGGDLGVIGSFNDDTTNQTTGLRTTVSNLTAPGETSAVNLITSYYGYIIDFAFRTNAAASNLLLQTDAINRVYENTGENLATMGGGSTGTFTYADTGLTADQAERLLEAICVVFFDPDNTNNILKVGKFTNIVAGSTSATGELELFNMVKNPVYSYVLGKDAYNDTAEEITTPVSYKANASMAFGGEIGTVTFSADNTVNYDTVQLITAEKYATLEEETALNAENKWVLGQNAYTVSESTKTTAHTLKASSITVGDETVTISEDNCRNYAASVSATEYEALSDTTTRVVAGYDITYTAATDNKLVALGQNEPKRVSALVFMDGENIDNSAVANAKTSGKLDLNLQFASDADLVPMENSALRNQTKE